MRILKPTGQSPTWLCTNQQQIFPNNDQIRLILGKNLELILLCIFVWPASCTFIAICHTRFSPTPDRGCHEVSVKSSRNLYNSCVNIHSGICLLWTYDRTRSRSFNQVALFKWGWFDTDFPRLRFWNNPNKFKQISSRWHAGLRGHRFCGLNTTYRRSLEVGWLAHCKQTTSSWRRPGPIWLYSLSSPGCWWSMGRQLLWIYLHSERWRQSYCCHAYSLWRKYGYGSGRTATRIIKITDIAIEYTFHNCKSPSDVFSLTNLWLSW